MSDQADKYEGMSHDQWCPAAAYDAVTSRPVEEIAARKPILGDWVFIDDYPTYNPHTGEPTTLRQIFTVTKVDDAGNVAEVYPRVLNYPHSPFEIKLHPMRRIRCYDPRVAFLEKSNLGRR
jgi:hypothetical protein